MENQSVPLGFPDQIAIPGEFHFEVFVRELLSENFQ
jgi:hypothetical protein